MRILAFDTATRATTAALSVGSAEPLERRDDPSRGERPRHTTRLMSLIAELLELGAVEWDDIDRLAVGVGPGTFTGLRIAVATAQALSQARGIPLVGVPTLESLATNALGFGGRAVLAVLDARRGEAFVAGWRPHDLRSASADGHRREPTRADRELVVATVATPDTLGEIARRVGPSTLAIGEGAVEFREVLERSGVSVPGDDSELHRVTAINHCRLALQIAGGELADVRPAYLRRPDAEIALDR
jgi:tRNA threonylcarbamoyladenosine biosynthesis protein TsaB